MSTTDEKIDQLALIVAGIAGDTAALFQKFIVGGAQPGPSGPFDFWNPSDAAATAFAARIGWTVHDLYGNRQANGSATDPLIVACDGTATDAELYAGFGFNALGARVLYVSENREALARLCDRLKPLTPAERDNVVIGSGQMDFELAAYQLMTNQMQGGGLAGSPHIGSFGGATTVGEAVTKVFAQTTRKPNDPGAGIAGM